VPSLAAKPRSGAPGAPPRPPAVLPWWAGLAAPPHKHWPGVTIEIPAVWRGRWESPDGVYYYDKDAADFAEGFFPTMLRHHIGEFDGRPFELMDYQRYLIVRPLFGWKRAADHLRRFRKVFLAVPKGNGKSPFGAGLGLLLAFFDHEPSAEVYAMAADKKQAKIMHGDAKVMTERSPELNMICEVLSDSIKLRESTESFQVISSEASTKHGYRPHGIMMDEFHAQPDRELTDTLVRGMGKRRQPVLAMITTAGSDDESICYEEWEYARKVIKGTVADATYLPAVFELKKGEDWTDLEALKRVNPGYGVTIKADYFASELPAAQAEPRKQNSFKQLHCNLWTNSSVAWIPGEWWDACDEPLPSEEVLAGLPTAAGLDLAQKWDLACLAVTLRQRLEQAQVVEILVEKPDGETEKRTVELNYRLIVVPHFWIPEETMREHEQKDGVPYKLEAAAGLITATDGAIIDYTRIHQDITTKIAKRFPRLKQAVIGYDPAFATDIASNLVKSGYKVAEVLQNFGHLSESCQVFEALVKGRRVVHGGHAVLRRHVLDCAVKTDDAGRIRPVRPKRGGKMKHIDGVVATLIGSKMLATVPDHKPGPKIFFMGGSHAPAPR
jgi:phage terminase large subunit-like protein